MHTQRYACADVLPEDFSLTVLFHKSQVDGY